MKLKQFVMLLCTDEDCGRAPTFLTCGIDRVLKVIRRATPDGIIRCQCGATSRVVRMTVPPA
jgi:hypothetical protein